MVEAGKESLSSMKPLIFMKLVRSFIRSGWYWAVESKNYWGGAGEASVHSHTRCDHVTPHFPGKPDQRSYSLYMPLSNHFYQNEYSEYITEASSQHACCANYAQSMQSPPAPGSELTCRPAIQNPSLFCSFNSSVQAGMSVLYFFPQMVGSCKVI